MSALNDGEKFNQNRNLAFGLQYYAILDDDQIIHHHYLSEAAKLTIGRMQTHNLHQLYFGVHQ